jgi:tetratricopeptide (TPR) repeat protein
LTDGTLAGTDETYPIKKGAFRNAVCLTSLGYFSSVPAIPAIPSRLNLRIRCLLFWSAVGTLIVGLTSRTPLAAQQSEQHPTLQCDQTKGLIEYQNDLKNNPRSSLANYCIGDLLIKQRNYQSSGLAYFAALKGDEYPSWTKVWSHLQLGKIADAIGDRDRAVRQYQLAIDTNDNTRGAVDEARKLLQRPYEEPRTP